MFVFILCLSGGVFAVGFTRLHSESLSFMYTHFFPTSPYPHNHYCNKIFDMIEHLWFQISSSERARVIDAVIYKALPRLLRNIQEIDCYRCDRHWNAHQKWHWKNDFHWLPTIIHRFKISASPNWMRMGRFSISLSRTLIKWPWSLVRFDECAAANLELDDQFAGG